MKTLIISDLHLTHINYNERKFNYLAKLINKFDQVIINGDFWCGLTSTFDQFVNSKWSSLFIHLKAKDTVYIQGNHDLFKYSDDRLRLFCNTKCEHYLLSLENFNLLIRHGHDLFYDWEASETQIKIRRFIKSEAFLLYIQDLFCKIFGVDTFRNIIKSVINEKQKTKLKEQGVEELAITSHSHAAEDDRENNFMNTGRIGSKYSSYISIINGNITLHSERF